MIPRLKLADLFCGAGLAADGYAELGFDITGVDLFRQKNYPYEFVQGDALDFDVSSFDLVHASPPCQAYSRGQKLARHAGYKPKFEGNVPEVIAKLRDSGKWFVVENVIGAPMDPGPGECLSVLCGTMFGLEVWRHRLFLTNFPVEQPMCFHEGKPWGVYHKPGEVQPNGGRTALNAEHARELMGVEREGLSWNEIKEGVPPAYTSYVASQWVQHVVRPAFTRKLAATA